MLESHAFCLLNSSTISHCPSCYYGPLCQFTTAYYGITSFQTLLCSIEYIPISIIISIFLLGSLLNLLAIGTYYQPKAREMVGVIYRLWIVIIGQIGLIIVVSHILLQRSNKEKIGCYILEYFRKALHASYDSLTACTTLERTILIYQGCSFNKMSSRRMSKFIIPILILYQFISILPEPFYRQLSYSYNRYWCILKFPTHSRILRYDSITNIFHFILPYFINLILPIVWIITLTKRKLLLNKNTSIWFNLKKVLFTQKHSLITCYLLVLLNTPRFIFTFYLTCIKQQWQNTAYITAYFLSLIPFMTNLLIFILPSPKYRPEFFGFIHRMMKYRYRSQYNLA